jgi:catechol 2,3-dioxygenase-like lactoylglutathione lyase family enzyme
MMPDNALPPRTGVGQAAVMQLNHLGLPVRDERRSQQFYSAYFGFDPATAQEYEDGTVIIRNAEGFDLALHPTEHIESSPAFLHAGFRVAAPDEVRLGLGPRSGSEALETHQWLWSRQ